jgi:hypothetical protein
LSAAAQFKKISKNDSIFFPAVTFDYPVDLLVTFFDSWVSQFPPFGVSNSPSMQTGCPSENLSRLTAEVSLKYWLALNINLRFIPFEF